MSADNFLIILKAPTLDRTGFDWYLLEARESGFSEKIWKRGYGHELLVHISYCAMINVFATEEEAYDACDTYEEDNIVEYGRSSYELRDPFPTKPQIDSAFEYWNAGEDQRRQRDQQRHCRTQIRHLRQLICDEHRNLATLRKCLSNPEWADFLEDLTRRDIPEAKAKITQFNTQLAKLRDALEKMGSRQPKE